MLKRNMLNRESTLSRVEAPADGVLLTGVLGSPSEAVVVRD